MKKTAYMILSIGFGIYATYLMIWDRPYSGYTMAVAVMFYVFVIEEDMRENRK